MEAMNAQSTGPHRTRGRADAGRARVNVTLGTTASPDTAGDPRPRAAELGLAFIDDLPSRTASALFVERIPIGYARRHGVLGLASEDGDDPLIVAVSTLDDLELLDVLGRFLARPVRPVLAPAADLATAINLAYQQRSGQAADLIEHLDAGRDSTDLLRQVQALSSGGGGGGGGGGRRREDLLDVASRAPVIKLVNLILFEAVKLGASDVHVQPAEQDLVVRWRIDGVLFDAFALPKALQDEVVGRIKVMGRMNIAEKRLAQDGRATVQVGDRVIDLRIASLPTSFGERVVVRLLDKSARLYRLGELGMEPGTLELFRQLIALEHGIILVTGPTGSGKTTTLYAALEELNRTQLNILTLEDPIEYQLPGISQSQVSDKKGMTFAGALRHVLRQDPDIILVGEIRDKETAVMAIQSALTGHLVFSTLHTNDAASAVTRLLDLGIEPYLLASSLVGVLAQRLVRKVCRSCGHPYRPSTDDLQRMGFDAASVDATAMRLGEGCSTCRQTGYSGRLGIFELLVVDEAVRRAIQDRATASAIASVAIASGMRTLRDDGAVKVLRGTSTIDEVLRVTMRTKV